MKIWPFDRKEQHRKVRALEDEVRAERGQLAVNIVNFERADNALDTLVRQHLQLLRGNNGEKPH